MLEVNRENGRRKRCVAVGGHCWVVTAKSGQNDPLTPARPHYYFQRSLYPRALHSCALVIPVPDITQFLRHLSTFDTIHYVLLDYSVFLAAPQLVCLSLRGWSPQSPAVSPHSLQSRTLHERRPQSQREDSCSQRL